MLVLRIFFTLSFERCVHSPFNSLLFPLLAMKKAEISNYAQKFVLPNAKLTVEYGSQFDRNLPYEMAGISQIDTRSLMKILREEGTLKGLICDM